MNLRDIWYDSLFVPVYEQLDGNSEWLYGFLLSVICLCRIESTICHGRSVNVRSVDGRSAAMCSVRADVTYRCMWYGWLAVLAWSDFALQEFFRYCYDHPDSSFVALLPPNWQLYWVSPWPIVLVMVSRVPRQPVVGWSRKGWELLLCAVTAVVVLVVAISDSIVWLVVLFCMLVEFSIQQPHLPPVAEWFGQDLPSAVRQVRSVCAASLLISLVGIGLLYPLRRYRRPWLPAAGAVLCTIISGLLVWYVDRVLIARVSPSLSTATITHDVSGRFVALSLVLPGIGWLGWWYACRWGTAVEVLCCDDSWHRRMRVVETSFTWLLTVCVALELCSQSLAAIDRDTDSLSFFAWAVSFLCCIRAARHNSRLLAGRGKQRSERYTADLSGTRLFLYSAMILIQLMILALSLQWLVGFWFLFAEW